MSNSSTIFTQMQVYKRHKLPYNCILEQEYVECEFFWSIKSIVKGAMLLLCHSTARLLYKYSWLPSTNILFLRKNIPEPPEYISFLSYLQKLILLPYIIQSKIFTGVYSDSQHKWEFTLFRYSDKGQIGYIFNIISNSEIYNKACANEFFKLSPKLPNEIHRKILQVFLLATKNSSKSDS